MPQPVQVFEGQGTRCKHCGGSGCELCMFLGECLAQYDIMNLDRWCRSVSFGPDRIVFWKPDKRFVKHIFDNYRLPFRMQHLPLVYELKKGIGELVMRDLTVVALLEEDNPGRLIMIVETQR